MSDAIILFIVFVVAVIALLGIQAWATIEYIRRF